MPRWRSSLALLGRIGTHEAQSHSFRPPFSLPDFLAPALIQSPPPTSRRHNASIARAAFEGSAFDSSSRSAGSSSNASPRLAVKNEPRRAQSHHESVDFSSYFNPGLPTRSSSNKRTAAATSSSCIHANKAYIKGQLGTAKDEEQIAATVKKLFHGSALKEERRSVNKSLRKPEASSSMLELHEHYLFCLLKRAYNATHRSGKNDTFGMDALVAGQLRRISKCVPLDAFSASFLAKFSGQASSKSSTQVLDQLLNIVQHRAHYSSTDVVGSNDISASLSRALLNLMQGFSHAGKPDRVRVSFDILRNHSLPATVFHYQLQLIALFRDQISQSTSQEQTDFERRSQQIQGDILQIKASMDANGVPIDDTFLATVVSGLSAPLRSPLSTYTSTAQATQALQLVRTVFSQIISSREGKSFQEMPRVLSALINAEIDALDRSSEARSDVSIAAIERIQKLLSQLEAQSTKAAASKGKSLSESQLAYLWLRIRFFSSLGDIPAALTHLPQILSLQPSTPPASTALNHELILKQRSSVIRLFSAVMHQRISVTGQDAAYEVLKLAFSAEWFERVWSGLVTPPNPIAGYDEKSFDGEATVFRLWKRWVWAWSADVFAEGSWRGAVDGKGEGERERYDTFVGRHRWQTLKRGLTLLNELIDQFEARQLPTASETVESAANRPSPIPPKLASLFNDRALLDTLVKVTLRGGRPPSDETMSTHVDRRLSLLIRTLTRTRSPARTWESIESSMLRHLALIDPTVLPTESVRAAMDEIDLRKRQALIRNRVLAQALRDAQQQQRGDSDREEERYALETGSIFVLRQMLQQRAARKQFSTSTQSRPLFS